MSADRNPEFRSVRQVSLPPPPLAESLLSILFLAALFGLRRAGRGRDDDWRRVWQVWAELGSPALPCTASWVQR